MEKGLSIHDIHNIFNELAKTLGPRQMHTACLFHNACIDKLLFNQ